MIRKHRQLLLCRPVPRSERQPADQRESASPDRPAPGQGSNQINF